MAKFGIGVRVKVVRILHPRYQFLVGLTGVIVGRPQQARNLDMDWQIRSDYPVTYPAYSTRRHPCSLFAFSECELEPIVDKGVEKFLQAIRDMTLTQKEPA